VGGLIAAPRARAGASIVGRLVAPTRGPLFWAAMWVLAGAAGFVALIPAIFGAEPPLSASTVVFRLVGVSFAGCGLIAWRRRPDSDVGRWLTAAGFGLFVYPVASQIDSDLVVSLARWFSGLSTVAFMAAILSFATSGRLESVVDRVLVATAFFTLFVLQFAAILFADYPDNALVLVHGHLDAFTTITDVQYAINIAVSAAIVVVIATRWWHASPPRRRALAPSVAGCLSSTVYAALLGSYLLFRTIPEWLSWASNIALLTIPAAFLAGLPRSRLARAGLADLFRQLGELRGADLERGLAKALGDPSLELVHDPPPPVAGRARMPIERGGHELGTLIYDPQLDDDPELVEAVTAAAAIALENERVHAESAARLDELRASRERIVAAGDAERRRLERDLHDGAQQRLVALSMQLGMLQRSTRDDPALARQLAAAGAEVSQSLQELRELARGIHPAVLNSGLEDALISLAARSVVPTAVSYEGDRALGERVELAAYFVACEALANVGKYAQATRASVRAVCRDGVATIEIADDGVGGADAAAGSGLRGLSDRVAALDGALRISSPPGAGTVVTAELPYVSGP
jgi:signal transduction histidine kinase